ncbi:YraN family protein [Herbiconiux sp.]|uniref:YraN family protein n=1 Tax=Herbiconiux sp. TaxID=1871186 RepID=UPI0025B928CF|nr:YraN family protein [Herbiconiux sp.]
MKAKDELGRRGEGIAVDYLTESGFDILARNWRCAVGEIDIVARDGPELVIIEVKTRSSVAYGHPFEAITPAKLKRLHLLAAAWAAEHPEFRAVRRRIDVVGIVSPSWVASPHIEHLREVE